MRHPSRAAWLFASVLTVAAPCAAAPAEIADTIHATKPYGAGTYGLLVVTAYTAQLWTDAPRWSMDAPFALTLHYDIGFSTDDMVSRSLREMKHVDPAAGDAALTAYGQKLAKAFPAVASGDRITALYVPGQPARFYRNGIETARIDDAKLNVDFFGIWLSPNSSAPGLRAKLLKGG
jgi:hypothetical protein